MGGNNSLRCLLTNASNAAAQLIVPTVTNFLGTEIVLVLHDVFSQELLDKTLENVILKS